MVCGWKRSLKGTLLYVILTGLTYRQMRLMNRDIWMFLQARFKMINVV